MSAPVLRAVAPRRLSLLARLHKALYPPRRYWRCSGCHAVLMRRWLGDPPRYHAFPCNDHRHRCGEWVRLSAGSASAIRARLS